jgi:hypothetical protein
MLSLALNSTKNQAWDLVVIDGELQTISNSDYLAQKVKQLLLFSQGEFFRNSESGIPWFQDFLGVKNPDIAALKSVIKDTLKNNAVLIALGVTSVEVNDVVIDKQSRSMSLKIEVATSDTTTVTEFTI